MTEPYKQPAGEPEPDISLVEIATAVGEEKFTIAAVAAVCTAVGLAICLLMTPVFTARTTLLPPQQGQGGGGTMAANLGALAASVGVAGSLKSQEELYVGLLKTDAVANALIDRLKLKERYEQQTLVSTRLALQKNVRIAADRKSTLISVDADDKDPAFAAQLANAYAEELQKLTGRLAVTEAQQRRLFFEQQMNKAKNEFAKAEINVKQAQDRSGLASVDAQTQSMIGAAAQIRGQIVTREVQLQAIRAYAGPENPDLRRLVAELAGLRTQLSKLEGGSSSGAAGTGGSPDALNNVRLYRELRFHEAIYTAMLQQFQVAKADEARDGPLIQQVDVAVAPDRKSKPARAVIVLVAAVAGLMLGLLVAFVRRAARKANENPASAESWRALVDAWSLRRRPARASLEQEPS